MKNYRILIIDDNTDIHSDFEKVLSLKKGYDELDRIESLLFKEEKVKTKEMPNFVVDYASQGEEGYRKVIQSVEENNPYALAFVDIRMPPGWNGVETVKKIWEVDQRIEIVFCSAYSDFSLDDIYQKVINNENEFLIIKKPFDVIEIRQTATSMCQIWNLKHKLEKRIEEVEGQLIHADKMASIGQLAAGVAHEINNPVGYINSNINTLQKYVNDLIRLIEAYQKLEDDSINQKNLSLINEIKEKIDLNFLKSDVINLIKESCEGVDRVKKIIKDLKDFSHRDNNTWDDYDLNKGITSTANIIKNEINSKKIKLDLVLGPIPKIEAYGSQVNQVILNLLVNASHSISNNGEITVITESDEKNVYLSIIDNGSGINDDDLQKIFEPFYTTKTVGEGTGLGLYLSYGIINKHTGQIEVSSVLGKGSTFKITLPIKQVPQNQTINKVS